MESNSYLINEISTMTNLYWAWEKAKWFYKPGDIWFDELEVSNFEANIDAELKAIRTEIRNGDYKLNLIRPVGFPKKKNEDGPRTRQTFWISVRDQVTWLAVMNIIGGSLDYKMPFWSYGNRIYISTFYEETEDNRNQLKFGFYRNTSKHSFRKWTQSWPLYRRHICLAAKFLSRNFKDLENELDDIDLQSIEINNRLEHSHPLKVRYIESEYWDKSKKEKLYWAGLDLTKFYPSVKIEKVRENIEKFLDKTDPKFIELIDSLLDFKLNLSQWNEDELAEVQLTGFKDKYPHIPTGLFVAGFLANVALLGVDTLLTSKLNDNKKIAHFRYVDDHVILSSSFEELVNWIEEYEIILKRAEVLTDEPFNTEKTEPKSIGDYFKEKETEDLDSISKAYAKAKIESEVDPEFPSPLMTQTLTKVSRIAGTEFQLLDPEEQRGLISDIEHLLVTEFPDNELRRDTRIAFAASMLTSLVPKVETSILKTYELSKKKGELIQRLDSEIAKSEKDDQKKANLIKEINDLERQIFVQLNEDKTNEAKLINRTIKLLKKSVRENHQKVRLWTRLIEFCFKSGCQIEVEVIEELNRLVKNDESNQLSITFIKSLIIQVLSNQLVNAYKVLSNENALYKSKERALRFIESVISKNLLDTISSEYSNDSKFYEVDTFNSFKFIIGTLIYLLKENKELAKQNWNSLIKEFALVDWNSNPKLFTKNTNYSFETWVWWITNKMDFKRNDEPSILWLNCIEEININDPIGQSIILLYPKFLPRAVIEKINIVSSEIQAFQNEGWQFELLQGIKKNEIKTFPDFLKPLIKKTESYKTFITIDEWIKWSASFTEEASDAFSASFDPRLGEWMALQLIKLIAKRVNDKVGRITIENVLSGNDVIEIHARAIHPRNFKMSRRLISDKIETWEQLKQEVANCNLDFIAKDNFIIDSRLSPIYESSSPDEKVGSVIGALGAMLVALLSKKNELPNKWNPIGHQFVWLGQMNSMLQNYPVSSYTRDIILGCFSKRNIETKILLKRRQDHCS